MKRLVLLVLLLVPTLAVAADGTPFTAAVGAHYFTLNDPVVGASSITFKGYEHDASAAPVEFAPGLQRCYSSHADCVSDAGVWLDVMFGEWGWTSGSNEWSVEWSCRPSKAFHDYRQMLILRLRDHSIRTVAPEGDADIVRARCAA